MKFIKKLQRCILTTVFIVVVLSIGMLASAKSSISNDIDTNERNEYVQKLEKMYPDKDFSNLSVQLLKDLEGNPTYAFTTQQDFYAIFVRETKIAIERSDNAPVHPYQNAGNYEKFYSPVFDYYYKQDGTYYRCEDKSPVVIDKKPFDTEITEYTAATASDVLPASENKSMYGDPDHVGLGNSVRVGKRTYVRNYDLFSQMIGDNLAINRGTTCGSVAISIVLWYYNQLHSATQCVPKNIATMDQLQDLIIPLVEEEGGSTYESQMTGINNYLEKYKAQLHFHGKVSGTTLTKSDFMYITDAIDRGSPTITSILTSQGWHAVAVYGYDLSQGLVLPELICHYGGGINGYEVLISSQSDDGYRVGSTIVLDAEDHVYEGAYHYACSKCGYYRAGNQIIYGKKYFADYDNKIYPRWQVENGYLSYYNYNKVKVTGNQTIDACQYTFDSSGRLQYNGVLSVEAGNYYLKNNVVQTGLQTVNKNTYYFDIDGRMCNGWRKIDMGTYYFSPQNGAMCKGQIIRDHGLYCLQGDGLMLRDSLWTSYNSSTRETICYYFDEDGAMARDRRLELDGKHYYFGLDGKAVTNQMVTVVGGTYYYGELGELWTGWLYTDDGLRYFDDDTGIMCKGLCKIHGNYYCFNNLGLCRTNFWFQNEGRKMYFGSDGAALRGWRMIDGKVYYFDAYTEKPYAASGQYLIYGAPYYFEATTNNYIMGWVYGRYYVFLENENRGAFKTSGKYCVPIKDNPDSGSAYYYFDNNGLTVSGRANAADGNVYFGDSTGKLITGWQTENGKKLYFKPSDYTMAQSEILEIDGTPYVFDADGQSAEITQTGWFESEGADYYWKRSGALAKNETLTINDITYTFGSDGRIVQNANWVQDGNDRYYYDPVTGEATIHLVYQYYSSGEYSWYLLGDWEAYNSGPLTLPSGDEVYYYPGTGRLDSGFINGKYYSPETGLLCKNCLTYLNGCYYYSNPDGTLKNTSYIYAGKGYGHSGSDGKSHLICNELLTVNADGKNKTYYCEQTGYIATGWRTVDGKTYYFKDDGVMAQNETLEIDGTTYVFDENGYGTDKLSGWVQVNNELRRYYDPKTHEMIIQMSKLYYELEGKRLWHLDNITAGRDSGRLTLPNGDDVYVISGERWLGQGFISDYYYLPETGLIAKGCVFYDDYNRAYYYADWKGETTYLNEVLLEGKGYVHQSGEYVLANNQMIQMNGDIYYCDENGNVVKNRWVTIGGHAYYFKSSDGKRAKNEKLIIDGKTYRFDENGYSTLLTGWVFEDSFYLKYYDPTTHQVTTDLTKRFQYYGNYEYRWWIEDIKNEPEDSIVTLANGYQVYHKRNGWIEPGAVYDGAGTYYVTEKPNSLPFSFTSSDPKLLLGADGFIYNGKGYIRKIGNYFTIASNKSIVISGTSYYFDENGNILSGFSISNDGTAYYYEEDGAPPYSYHRIIMDGIGYEFNSGNAKGTRIYDQMLYAGNNEYYHFNEDGYMTTGWLTVNGNRYYFKENGKRAHDETLLLDDLVLYSFSYDGLVTDSRPYNGED